MKKRVILFFGVLCIYSNLFSQGTPPVLSNFRVESSEPSRVYFDSSESITGSSVSGFVISGKSISGVSISSGSRSGHYFTVSSSFTFWDNNTIRYTGGSNLKDSDGLGVLESTQNY